MNTSSNSRNDLLKLIAIFSMVIDHIGLVFFPQDTIFRFIGRIAFPLFAYHIALGVNYTSNIYKYVGRLFIFGVISQIPYSLMSNTQTLNIMFTLGLGVLLVHTFRERKYIWSVLIAIGTLIIPVDYGLYGVAFPLIFSAFRYQPKVLITVMVAWTLTFVTSLVPLYQMLCLLGVALPFFPWFDKYQIQLPRYFFYTFYPLHLVVIYLVSLII